MIRKFHFKLVGLSALRTHSARLADPLDPVTRQVKALSTKRKRTPEEEELLSKAEALGGMYIKGGEIFFPGANLKAALVDSAKRNKMGTAVERSVVVLDETIKFTYSGPTDPTERINDPSCIDRRIVSLNPQSGSKGVRCRPVFENWVIEGVIAAEVAEIAEDQLKGFFQHTGFLGICEHHGGFGRFDLTEFGEV